MQVEVESGSEIQAEGVAGNEEVRERINAQTLTQQVTEMEQGNTQSCPTMHGITFWPELFGEVLARMGVAFYRQIDEKREFFACGEQHLLICMVDVRWTQYSQA
jgi:hypothetical protein